MMFLVENKSPNFSVILNDYHDLVTKKLLEKLLPMVARSKFAEHFISIVFRSHAFKGLYYEEVKNTGLVH